MGGGRCCPVAWPRGWSGAQQQVMDRLVREQEGDDSGEEDEEEGPEPFSPAAVWAKVLGGGLKVQFLEGKLSLALGKLVLPLIGRFLQNSGQKLVLLSRRKAPTFLSSKTHKSPRKMINFWGENRGKHLKPPKIDKNLPIPPPQFFHIKFLNPYTPLPLQCLCASVGSPWSVVSVVSGLCTHCIP